MGKTFKPCAETSIPTDNTPLTCDEFISTECIIHPDAMVELELPENSTAQDILNAFLSAIINLNNKITDASTVESGQLSGTDLILTKTDSSTVTIDMSPLLDDTNLARIVSGTVENSTLILTRDDSSTLEIDLSTVQVEQNNEIRVVDLGVLTLGEGAASEPEYVIAQAINQLNPPLVITESENIIFQAIINPSFSPV